MIVSIFTVRSVFCIMPNWDIGRIIIKLCLMPLTRITVPECKVLVFCLLLRLRAVDKCTDAVQVGDNLLPMTF